MRRRDAAVVLGLTEADREGQKQEDRAEVHHHRDQSSTRRADTTPGDRNGGTGSLRLRESERSEIQDGGVFSELIAFDFTRN